MGVQEEQFDIYDKVMQPIGTASREEVHAKGWWHRTFQCWIWDAAEPAGEGSILFQERHPGKDTFPGLLDISCAGHLLAGESVEDGVRELQEELGVEVSFDRLISCGIFAEEDELPGGRMDREFCHVFVLPLSRPLESYRLQEDEVTGLYRMPLPVFRRLAEGLPLTAELSGAAVDAKGQLLPAVQRVTPERLVPHSPAYYRLVLDAVERLTDGGRAE
ncbi:NUDIX hydrolase [Paenibacillus caseinilyticus]|uniref:Hydrolase n=1 Tax=Paenibacillus mucilaginosus K02 TaxID=997761 RepID=I0BJR8_9BACL|nr:NUDIX domain-containing protein [Paenibacillus mucilaginosus]AFH62615.1 hydrolase [Paenibacillus mucilaginosus K02]